MSTAATEWNQLPSRLLYSRGFYIKMHSRNKEAFNFLFYKDVKHAIFSTIIDMDDSKCLAVLH